MGLFDGTVDHTISQLRPVITELEQTIAAAVSFAIQGGIDRINGAKITVTIEFPPAKAVVANPPTQ